MGHAGGTQRVWLWSMPLAAVVSEGSWPVVLALGLALLWLWWVIDARGIAAVKGRQADAWTAVALLTGPLGWLAVKALPAAKPPRAAEAYAAAMSVRVRQRPARPRARAALYARRRWQAEA